MKHQIYGIFIFAGIILLIYLLNYSYIYQNRIENFATEEEMLADYTVYDNAFINLDTKSTKTTLIEALDECNKNSNYIGVTKEKTSVGVFYLIKQIDFCKTKYMGSDLEKDQALNYKTYIKKTVESGNGNSICLVDEVFDTKFNSITSYNNSYFVVDSDYKIQLRDAISIDSNKQYTKSRFKLVKGLSGTNTVSFKYLEAGKPDKYIVNDYPQKSYLYVREIQSNENNWKKKASFRMLSSLNSNSNNSDSYNQIDFSLRIVGFPNMYVIADTAQNYLTILPIESVDQDLYDKSAFKLLSELTSDSIKSIEQTFLTNKSSKQDITGLSGQDKMKVMKTKNLHTLDQQTSLLDNQTNMMNAYDFIHTNNISNISREFANQAAILALSKYIQEKEDMEKIQKQNGSGTSNPFNTPSVSNMTSTS